MPSPATKPLPRRSTTPTMRNFAEDVATMRRLQKAWFKTPRPDLLAKCDQLEKAVDAQIEVILGSPVTLPSIELCDQD